MVGAAVTFFGGEGSTSALVIGAIFVGAFLGGFCAGVAALVVSLLPTTSGGPRGQH